MPVPLPDVAWTPSPAQGEGPSPSGTAGSRWTGDGPAALTHLEEKQVGLKKGTQDSRPCPHLDSHWL